MSSKIIERIRKLLALAADGSGATEAEASVAAGMAASIMEEHGLAMAAITAGGGKGEGRVDEHTTGGAFFNYQEELMRAVADSAFVHVEVIMKRRGAQRTEIRDGFRLIGRESAVVGARVLFDYLDATIMRLTREARPEVPKWFRRGMAERIGERLEQRHREVLAKQQAEAEKARSDAAARGTSTAGALVVTLVDYAQSEADENDDLRWGREPGTTAAKRAAEAARTAAQEAEHTRLQEEEGLSWTVGYWMVYGGMSRENAIEREEERDRQAAEQAARPRKEETEAEREKRHDREDRWRQQQNRRAQAEARKRSSSSWQSGRATANDVGLDRQVNGHDTKKLT